MIERINRFARLVERRAAFCPATAIPAGLLRFAAVSITRRLLRPEYVFRPSSFVRRLRLPDRGRAESMAEVSDVELAWSQRITVFPDALGRNVIATGVFDPVVTEVIYRLVEPGCFGIDVGANIGYFTNLMATRAGPRGRVLAFEPHPNVFDVLSRNTERWNEDPALAMVEARRVAISDERGDGRLSANTGPQQMGIAALRGPDDPGSIEDFHVTKDRLDDLCKSRPIQLLKLDVEGHEYAVLRGAEQLLGDRRIRDIVFEDFETYPTPAMTFLERQGLTVFTLDRSIIGLRVRPVREGPAPRVWPGRNYLATLDPSRAMRLLGGKGWLSLRLGRRRWFTSSS